MSGQKLMCDFFSSGSKKRPGQAIFDESKSSPSGSAKRRRICKIDGQMALDAGQAKIGAQKCEKCDMVYSLDAEEDVTYHNSFCDGTEGKKALFVKKFTVDGWVKKVLSIAPGHPSYPRTGACIVVLKVEQGCSIDNLKAKVEEIVKNHVNASLGYTEEGSMWNSNLSSTYSDPTPSSSRSPLISSIQPRRKAFMAISRDEKGISSIAGVLLAESICRAIDVDGEKMIRADKLMGVNRLWVNEEMRGRGIAKMMVDTARESFFSLAIPSSRVVFSEPTKDGEQFARSYVRNDHGRLLVYNLGDGDKWKGIMKKMIELRRRSQQIIVEEKKEEEENTVDEGDNSENVVDEKLSSSPLSEQL